MILRILIGCVVALGASAPVSAAERTTAILIRAGKSDTVNHALAVQFAEAIAVASNGAFTPDVQESQGSIANVLDLAKAPADYIFTAGPAVIATARRGAKPFAPNPRYRTIRALFPIPAQTIEWVVRRDTPISSLADMAGHGMITGVKGGLSERVTTEALQALGIDREVQIMDIQPAGALPALASNQVSGVALAGPYPLPELQTFAQKTPIRILTMPGPQLGSVLASDDTLGAEVVPRAAYGTDQDAVTLALPAGVYTTTRMREATAYALTKAFWTQHEALVKRNPAWQAATASALVTLGATLHRGALRYYREARMPVPKSMRGEPAPKRGD